MENIDARLERKGAPLPVLQIGEDVHGVNNEINLTPVLFFPIVID